MDGWGFRDYMEWSEVGLEMRMRNLNADDRERVGGWGVVIREID